MNLFGRLLFWFSTWNCRLLNRIRLGFRWFRGVGGWRIRFLALGWLGWLTFASFLVWLGFSFYISFSAELVVRRNWNVVSSIVFALWFNIRTFWSRNLHCSRVTRLGFAFDNIGFCRFVIRLACQAFIFHFIANWSHAGLEAIMNLSIGH